MKRYNKLGEWKPIIYCGNSDLIEQEVKKLSDNSIVQGTLFYAKTTGYNCIEFVMKTSIDLPIKGLLIIDDILHIYKCPPLSDSHESIIYDCWLDIHSLKVSEIESELQRIRLAVNRIGIAFRSPIEWCVKYDNARSISGKGKVSDDDMEYFKNILIAPVNKYDLYLLEYAIDWYNQALIAKNPFTKYLCYFTSMELLVTKIADGETGLHSGVKKLSRSEKIECIKKIENEIRDKSILQFIQDSYDNCIKSIKRKFQLILKCILGKDHWSIKLFFEGENSLLNIRNKIVHGEFSLYNKEHELIVKTNLHNMSDLSREFILRLLLSKSPDEKLEDWGNVHILSMQMTDPRNTLVSSTDTVFPTNDWRIRPEWCS